MKITYFNTREAKIMKAILIRPESQSIEPVEVNDKDEIIRLIGFDTLIGDDIGSSGDKLYFDEECFLRGTEGRFQIDKLIPVSGIGIVIGSDDGETLSDVNTDIDKIRARTKFL